MGDFLPRRVQRRATQPMDPTRASEVKWMCGPTRRWDQGDQEICLRWCPKPMDVLANLGAKELLGPEDSPFLDHSFLSGTALSDERS